MAFSIVADIQVRTPNLANVANQIRNSLSGIVTPVNVTLNTGSISNITRATGVVNSLTASLNKLTTAATSAEQAMSLLAQTTANLQRITTVINTASQASAGLARNLRPVADAAEAAGRRFLGFTVVTGAVVALTRAFKTGLTEAIEFERELTKFTQVGVATAADLRNISNEVTRLSTTYGVSSKELLQSATTLKQAGLAISQVRQALESLAQSALAPSFDTLAKTTEGLIAVMSQFRLTTQQGAEALGAINAVSNAYAVESRDLIEAVKRAGGAFASAGGDINEFIGAFTSVRATTREGAEAIATGLRTIFARAQRGDTVEALREMGINLRFTREEAEALGRVNLTDQFVGGAEAIRRVSEALAQIRQTDPRYARVVEELGGYRQISRLLPLLQNVTLAQEAFSVAQGGSLSIALAADQAQNTVANSLARVREEFLALTRSIVSSPAFSSLISQLTTLTSNVLGFINVLRPVLPILTTLATIRLGQSALSFFRGASTGGGKGFLGFARGGVVPGSGSGDTVPANLEPGEFVVKKRSAQAIGYDALYQMNKFAGGGSVREFPDSTYEAFINYVARSHKVRNKLDLTKGFTQTRLTNFLGMSNLGQPSAGGLFNSVTGQVILNKENISTPDLEQIFFHEAAGHGLDSLASYVNHNASGAGTYASHLRLSPPGKFADFYKGQISPLLEKISNPAYKEYLTQPHELFAHGITSAEYGLTDLQRKFLQPSVGNKISDYAKKNIYPYLRKLLKHGKGLGDFLPKDGNYLDEFAKYSSQSKLLNIRGFTGGGPVSSFLTNYRRINPGSADLTNYQFEGADSNELTKRFTHGTLLEMAGALPGSIGRIYLERYGASATIGTSIGKSSASRIIKLEPSGKANVYNSFIESAKQGSGFGSATYLKQLNQIAAGNIETITLDAAGGGKLGRAGKYIDEDYSGYYVWPTKFGVKGEVKYDDIINNIRDSDYSPSLQQTLIDKLSNRYPHRFEPTPISQIIDDFGERFWLDFGHGFIGSINRNNIRAFQLGNERIHRGFGKFASGGPVFGGTPGRDSVPAMLEPKEFVIQAKAASKIGLHNLNYMNKRGELPQGFAEGGQVGSTALTRISGPIATRFTDINYRALFDALRSLILRVQIVGIAPGIQASRQITGREPFVTTPSSPRLLLTDQSAYRHTLSPNPNESTSTPQSLRNFNTFFNQPESLKAFNQYIRGEQPRAGLFSRVRTAIGNYFTHRETLEDGTQGPSRLERFGPYGALALAGATAYSASLVRSGTEDPTQFLNNQGEFRARRGIAAGLEGAATYGTLGGIAGSALIGGAYGGPIGAGLGAATGALIAFTQATKEATDELSKTKIDKSLNDLSETIDRINKGQTISLAEINNSIQQINTIREESLGQAVRGSTGFFGGITNFQQNLLQAQRRGLQPLAPGFNQILNRQVDEYGRNLARQPGFSQLRGNDIRDLVRGQREQFLGGQSGLNREIFESIVLLRSQQDPNARQSITDQIERSLVNAAQRENLRQRGALAGERVERESLTFSRLAQAVELSIASLQGFQQQLDSLDSLFNNQINSVRVFSREDVFSNFGSGQVGAALAPYRGVFGDRADSLLNEASQLDLFRQAAPDIIAQVVAGGDLGTESADQRFRSLVEQRFGRNNGFGSLTSAIGTNLSDTDFLTEERRRLLRTNPDRFISEASGRSLNDREEAVQQFERSMRELGERISQSFTRMEQRVSKLIDAEERRSVITLTGERLLSQLNANTRLEPSRGALSVARENQLFAGQNVRLALNSGLAPALANNPAAIGAFLAEIQREIPEVIAQRNASVGGSDAFSAASERLSYLQGSAARLTQALENLTNTTNTTAAAQRRLGEIDQDRQSRLAFGERFLSSDVSERNRVLRSVSLIQENERRGGGLRGFSPNQQSEIIGGLRGFGNAEITIGGRRVRASEYLQQQVQQALPATGLAPGTVAEERDLIGQIGNAFNTAREAQNVLIESLRSLQTDSARLLRDTISGENNRFLTEFSNRLLEADRRAAQTALQANAYTRGQLVTQTTGLDFLRGFGVDTNNQAAISYLTGGQGLQQIEAYRTQQRVRDEVVRNLGSLEGTVFNTSAARDVTSLGNNAARNNVAQRLLTENQASIRGLGVEDPAALLESLSNSLRSVVGQYTTRDEGVRRRLLSSTLQDVVRTNLVNRGFTAVAQQNTIAEDFTRGGGTRPLLERGLTDEGLRRITDVFRDLSGINLQDYTRNLNTVNAEFRSLTVNLAQLNNQIAPGARPPASLSAGQGFPGNYNPIPSVALPLTGSDFGGGANVSSKSAGAEFADEIKKLDSVSTNFNEFTNALKPFTTALENFPSTLTGSFQHKLDVNVNGGELLASLEPLTKKLIVGEVKKQLSRYIEQNLPAAGIVQ